MKTARALIAGAILVAGCGGASTDGASTPAASAGTSASAVSTLDGASPTASAPPSASAIATGPNGCTMPPEVQTVERWPELDALLAGTPLSDAAPYLTEKNWQDARKQLEADLKQLPADAPVDVRLAGQARLGFACSKLDDEACAAKAYGAVLAAWKGTTTKAIEDAAGTDMSLGRVRTNRITAVQRAHLAVGEALFYVAEEKRKALEAVAMPVYAGEYALEPELSKYIDEKVKPWAVARQTRIDEAEAAFHEIEALSPAPQRWVVPALSRIAQVRAKFVTAFRASPIPKQWKQNGPASDTENWEDVRDRYYAAIDRAAAPYSERVREAFDVCQRAAASAGTTGGYAQACDKWLTKNANVCERPPPPEVPPPEGSKRPRRPVQIPEF